MQYYVALKSISLLPFPTCLPTGSHVAEGRAQPATAHNDTTSPNRTKDFPQLLPKAEPPDAGSRDAGPLPPPWL